MIGTADVGKAKLRVHMLSMQAGEQQGKTRPVFNVEPVSAGRQDRNGLVFQELTGPSGDWEVLVLSVCLGKGGPWGFHRLIDNVLPFPAGNVAVDGAPLVPFGQLLLPFRLEDVGAIYGAPYYPCGIRETLIVVPPLDMRRPFSCLAGDFLLTRRGCEPTEIARN